MEVIILVLGMLLAGNQHSVNTEYEFYRGLGIGCAGATLTITKENFVEVPIEQVIDFCEEMVIAAQWRDLYGE